MESYSKPNKKEKDCEEKVEYVCVGRRGGRVGCGRKRREDVKIKHRTILLNQSKVKCSTLRKANGQFEAGRMLKFVVKIRSTGKGRWPTVGEGSIDQPEVTTTPSYSTSARLICTPTDERGRKPRQQLPKWHDDGVLGELGDEMTGEFDR